MTFKTTSIVIVCIIQLIMLTAALNTVYNTDSYVNSGLVGSIAPASITCMVILLVGITTGTILNRLNDGGIWLLGSINVPDFDELLVDMALLIPAVFASLVVVLVVDNLLIAVVPCAILFYPIIRRMLGHSHILRG